MYIYIYIYRNSEVRVSKCTHIDSTFACKLMHSVSKLVLSNAANVANGLRFLKDPLQRVSVFNDKNSEESLNSIEHNGILHLRRWIR